MQNYTSHVRSITEGGIPCIRLLRCFTPCSPRRIRGARLKSKHPYFPPNVKVVSARLVKPATVHAGTDFLKKSLAPLLKMQIVIYTVIYDVKIIRSVCRQKGKFGKRRLKIK